MIRSAILASLFIYLCATTCIGEFLKVPVLFLHFIEHRADNQSISFYQFIYQHYQDDDGNDQDNDRDSQLPFKSYESSVAASTAVPVLLSKIRFSAFSQASCTRKTQYREPDIPSPYLSRVWQPPKSS